MKEKLSHAHAINPVASPVEEACKSTNCPPCQKKNTTVVTVKLRYCKPRPHHGWFRNLLDHALWHRFWHSSLLALRSQYCRQSRARTKHRNCRSENLLLEKIRMKENWPPVWPALGVPSRFQVSVQALLHWTSKVGCHHHKLAHHLY